MSLDVGVLATMLRARWSEIEGKSAIQRAEVDEAQDLSDRIAVAYATRAQQNKRVAVAADDRARAYSLVLISYDGVRRAISYLRWAEGDVEKLAPSLWTGQGIRPAKKAPAPSTPDAPTPTTTPDAPQLTSGPPILT